MLVLCIDEDSRTGTYLDMILPSGFSLIMADNFESLRKDLLEIQFDLILLDIEFEDGCGIDLISYIQRLQGECPIVVHTNSPNLQDVVSSMSLGVYQFVHKLIGRSELVDILLHCRAIQENSYCRRLRKVNPEEIDIILDGCVAHKTVQQMLRICQTGTIFLNGERGTGKIDIARHLSNEIRVVGKLYQGATSKFISYSGENRSCSLQEVDLFGSEKDFFQKKISIHGLIQNNPRSFVFIEEITSIHKEIQRRIAKYFNYWIFQKQEYGKRKTSKNRVVFGSIYDVNSPEFQNAIVPELMDYLLCNRVQIKPLRERNNNLISLSWIYLHETIRTIPDLTAQTFHPSVFDHLLKQRWPGNIPELRNYIIKGVRNCKNSEVTVSDFYR